MKLIYYARQFNIAPAARNWFEPVEQLRNGRTGTGTNLASNLSRPRERKFEFLGAREQSPGLASIQLVDAS